MDKIQEASFLVKKDEIKQELSKYNRQQLGEMYNQWLTDNNRKDGNYSSTVFDFLYSVFSQSSTVKDDELEDKEVETDSDYDRVVKRKWVNQCKSENK